MIREKSCGAVVFTKIDDEIKYLLISNLQGDIGFPKGHVEANETEEETALREVYEETKLKINLLKGFRETHEVTIRGGAEDILKDIIYFLGFFENQEIFFQKEELSKVYLVNYKEANEILRSERLKQILEIADKYLKMN